MVYRTIGAGICFGHVAMVLTDPRRTDTSMFELVLLAMYVNLFIILGIGCLYWGRKEAL